MTHFSRTGGGNVVASAMQGRIGPRRGSRRETSQHKGNTMKARLLLVTVLATATALSALADYTISSDTTYGDGSEVTWGTDPFTGNFLFTGSASSITFYNPIQLDGNTLKFIVPSGKTAHMSGRISNNVAFNKSSGYEYRGCLLRNLDGDGGTLIFDGGINQTSLQTKYGVTEVNGTDSTCELHYLRVWGGSSQIILNGGRFESDGEVMVAGGTITLTNCTFNKRGNSTYIGQFNVSQGTLRQINSTVTSGGSGKLVIGGTGSGSSDTGVYVMDGGSLDIQGGVEIGKYGTGTFNLLQGTFNHPTSDGSQHWIADQAGSRGTMNVSGGVYQFVGEEYNSNGRDERVTLTIGNRGNGILNLSGTGRFFINRLSSSATCRARVFLGKNAGSSGTLNLNEGGTFATFAPYGIIGGDGTSTLVFNGGTFEAAGNVKLGNSWAPLIETNVQTVAVGPKGGAVDTAGNSFHFCDPIVDLDATATPEGFFTKRGTGTLTFHGANTYSAPTRVSEGTIALADDGALSPNSQLWVDSGITVNLSGAAAQTVGGLAGKGTISNVSLTNTGAICPGGTNEIGTLTLSNCPLTLAAGSRLVIDVDAQGNCDTLVVTGTSSPLNLSGIVIEVTGAGATADAIGPIIQCAAGVTGEPRRVIGTKCIAVTADASGNVRLSKPGTTLFIR